MILFYFDEACRSIATSIIHFVEYRSNAIDSPNKHAKENSSISYHRDVCIKLCTRAKYIHMYIQTHKNVFFISLTCKRCWDKIVPGLARANSMVHFLSPVGSIKVKIVAFSIRFVLLFRKTN